MLLVSALMFSAVAGAQTDRQHIRSGNKQFNSGKYADAEVEYRKALDKNPKNPQAIYNLGNALLAQGKDSAAVSQFETAAKLETSPLRKSKAYHNMGVVCQKARLYQEAITAYEESLRLNPDDNETRYNLAVCKRQKQKQDQQNKDNKDNKDKDKDKQDQNKDNNKQDQNKDKQKQEPKRPKPEDKDKMSKENAEQLLNAAMQQEKDTQRRMKEIPPQPGKRRLQKNW
ncbi:MAG: tetratricopeptide repeat protein [Prevotella sp.]|nr:tetratricopeptide repeat protein [Prevotella sp.]